MVISDASLDGDYRGYRVFVPGDDFLSQPNPARSSATSGSTRGVRSEPCCSRRSRRPSSPSSRALRRSRPTAPRPPTRAAPASRSNRRRWSRVSAHSLHGIGCRTSRSRSKFSPRTCLPRASGGRHPRPARRRAPRPARRRRAAPGSASRPQNGSGAARPHPSPRSRIALSARQLFEAKDMDYNPRRPFFIAVGALGVAAAAAIGYFLLQIYAPRASFYTGPAAGKSTPIATAPLGAACRRTGGPAPPPPPRRALRQQRPRVRPSRPRRNPPHRPGPPLRRGPARQFRVSRARRPSQPVRSPRRRRAAPRPGRALHQGQPPRAAGGAGARTGLASAGERQPGAGQGGVSARAGREPARPRRVARPRDDRRAHPGLRKRRGALLQGPRARPARPLRAGRHHRSAGADRPGAVRKPTEKPARAAARFRRSSAIALGNHYAVQARWSDAQAAYFKAYSADAGEPDYAYNLAVSLDQLHQPKLALEYYRRALALAANRAVGFNSAQVEARIRELTR